MHRWCAGRCGDTGQANPARLGYATPTPARPNWRKKTGAKNRGMNIGTGKTELAVQQQKTPVG